MNPFVHGTCLFNINVAVHFSPSPSQFSFSFSNKNENQNECCEEGKLSLHLACFPFRKMPRGPESSHSSRFDKREKNAT
jgi:hypothetical protein